MYARVTKYRLKPGHIEAATALAESMKPDIMALPGIQQFLNVVNDDGAGYVIALVSSEAEAQGSLPRVKEIWGRMGEHLAGMPTPEGFDVVAHWTAS